MTTLGSPAASRLPGQVRRAARVAARVPEYWPPAPGLADHRLVFLAAKPALRVLSQSRLGQVLSAFERSTWNTTRGGGSRGMVARDMTAEARGENMRSLVLACDEVAERMSADELGAVRTSGLLPAWFVPAVHMQARDIRRQWRGR